MSNVSDVFDCSVDCVHLEKHKYLLMVYVLSPSEHMDSDGQVNCGNDVHDRQSPHCYFRYRCHPECSKRFLKANITLRCFYFIVFSFSFSVLNAFCCFLICLAQIVNGTT